MSNVVQSGSPQISTPETSIGMVLQLTDATIAACNPRAAEILGYTTEQLIGTTSFDLSWHIHEDGSPFGLEEYPAIAALRSGQPVTDVVVGFYRPDGQIAWLKLDSQPLFQANEAAPYAVVTTILEIAPRQLTSGRSLAQQEALNPQLIELESIYTTAPIGLCFVDPDLRFVRINQYLADINGLAISQHIGRTLREILPEQADELEPLYRQAIASGEPRLNLKFHGINRAQPEVERDWIVSLNPLKQADGQVLGVNVMVREVTECQRLEQDLREANQRTIAAWESMTDAYLSLDREWRLTYVNQAAIQLFYQLTNLEPEAFLGKTHWEIFPWSIGQVVEQQYRRAMTEQVPVHFEVLYEPTGNWFELHAYPSTAGLGVYFREIGDRKQTELALQESASRFRTLADNIAQLAWMADKDGWIFWYNQRWFDYTGTTLEEMQGWGWQKVHHPDHLERVVERFSHCLATGEFWEDTFPLRSQDGQYSWFLSRAIPIRDEQGEVVRWFGTNTDISDRIQAEQTLQQRHKKLNLLYETTNGLLSAEQPLTFINDLFSKLSTQLDLQYYFNFMVEERDRRQMLRLKSYAGISEAAAQAIEWLEFGQGVCGLVAQERQQIVVDCVQQSTLPNAYIIRSLGITAYVSQPLIAGGRLLGTLSFASSTRTSFTSEEIALMKAATDQIAVAVERANLLDSLQQQTEQLIQTNRLKDEFLAVLSHELRSPLNPILGWVKLLQSHKFSETKTAEALATIERNAQLQAQLIEDLLDISRFMRGKIALDATPVNLAYIISSALETVQLAAEAKTIQLQVTFASPTVQVFGDATRLQQVVWNLLSNAIKFTPNGGRVEISLKEVGSRKKIAEEAEEAEGEAASRSFAVAIKPHSPLPTPHSPIYAQIQVTDTGKGIASDFLPYVFEYFRQEDGSTTRKFGGLGLGLAIAKQIVEMHGGTLEADSLGEGHGATFTLQIPLMQHPEEDLSDAPINPVTQTTDDPLADMQILLVDDDADTCEFLSVVLEKNGAIVYTAASAAEALRTLERSRPNLILSDIGMPEIDGYEFIRTIRSSASARFIPAIALTAYAHDLDRQEALAAGFQRHFAKPLDVEAVISSIAELVQQQRSLFD